MSNKAFEDHVRYGIDLSYSDTPDFIALFNIDSIKDKLTNKRDDNIAIISIKVAQKTLDDTNIDIIEILGKCICDAFIKKETYIENGYLRIERDPYSCKPFVMFYISWYGEYRKESVDL